MLKNKVYVEKNETLEELLTQVNESQGYVGGSGEGANTVCISCLYGAKFGENKEEKSL